MRNYRLCYQTFRRLGIWNVALYPATDLAITLATLGRFDEAIALADTMLRDCQTHGYRDQLPMVYGVLGRVRLIQGRPREAAAALRRALERSDVGEADVLSHAVEGLVRSLIRSDSLAAALRVLETRGPRAAARGARHRSAELTAMRGECLLGLDRPAEADAEFERAGRQAEAQSIAGLAAETWLGSARARRALGDTSGARAALARAERQWERDRAVPTDAEWREQHGARGRAIAEQALELELGEGAPPPARVRAAFDRLQRYKSRTLLERLRGSLSAPEDSAAFAPVTLAALQHQILQPGELLLDFFAGERTVVLFAVSRDSVQLGRLPAEALREPLALFRDLVRRPPTPGADAQGLARRAARKLGRQLLGPAQDLVSGSGRLLVAADGVLHLVPFGSLEIDQGGRPRVLIESHEVASVVSATLLARLRSRSARPASAGLLAVSGAASENFRGVEREIQELRGSFRNVTTVAGQADSAVLAELPRYQVLHFAGHSDVDDQHPWQSPVPGLRDARGPLTAEKIAVLRLNARLAVLSSCESGGGRVLSGEGVAGLSTAFLSAGVPAVAASLWPVDDRATARFMAWFYDELARGRPVAAALAAAQNRARREPRMAHPFFWAAFVLVGDPSAAVRLEANPLSPRRAGSYAALVALAMAGAWWLSFRVAGRRQPRP
jgi:CHAT domain-containing protein